MGKLIERPQEDATGKLELRDGMRLSRSEFHQLYSLAPEGTRAELIGGVVYMASPLKYAHGTNHNLLSWLFVSYEIATPGIEVGDNATVQLADDSEPQPDLLMRIERQCGGLSTITFDDYIEGPPELIAEVAFTSRRFDLNEKRDEYARYGVQEYLVLDLRDNLLHWFDLRANVELQPDCDGIYRIRSFPGLWIDGAALVTRNFQGLTAALNAGLASHEHAAYVARLAAVRALQS